MDEGTKNVELIFRISLAAKAMMLKMAIAILKAYLDHLKWMKTHNMKSFGNKIIDKLEVGTTRTLSTLIEKRKDICQNFIELKNKEIDKFKLDKQYELETHKTEVSKAQKALDLARENKSPEDIAIKQTLLDQALENKKSFEYKTNQEIMDKNHELDNYKNELNQLEYDLKVCNAELNALDSNKNIETGVLKKEYNNIKEKYNSQELDADPQQEEKISSLDEMAKKYEKPVQQEQEKDVHEEKEVELSIDELLKNYDKKQQEVNIDDVEKDVEFDIVAQMFSKSPEELKIYQDKKEKGDFKLNVPELSKDKGMDIGGM